MLLDPDRLLTALYDTLPDPVVVTNHRQIIMAVNPAVEQVFGYSRADLIGTSSARLFASPDHAAAVDGQIYPINQLDARYRTRSHFARKNGDTFEGHLSVSRINGSDGAGVGFVAVVHDLSDVLAAEAERKRSDSILQAALAFIPEGFVVFDDQDRLLLYNQAYLDIYRASAAVIHPGTDFATILRYGVETGQYPEAGTTMESREAWMQQRLQSHLNPTGPIIQQVGHDRWIQLDERVTPQNYRVGIRTDITGLQTIRNEAERLGRILENVGQEIFVFDSQTLKFLVVNRCTRDNLQYSLSELQQLTPVDIAPEFDADQFEALLAPLRSGERAYIEFRTQHQRKDATTYPCTIRLELQSQPFGNAFVAFSEDISEKREIETRLARKRMEYETLVANLPDAISRARPDTTLTYVNDIYAEFLGLSPEAMIGRKFVEFIPVEVREAAVTRLAMLTPDNPIRTFEQPMVDRQGREYLYLWSNLMTYRDGKPAEIVSVGRDITEQRNARDRIARQSRELRLRNDALEQFAGIVSHDLKAPLRHIRSFAEMIADDVAAGRVDELPMLSGQVSSSVRRMERMISSLLDFSQVAYKTVNPQPFRLADAVAEAWENLAAVVRETGATQRIDARVDVVADYELIVLLFQNLIANSLKYRAAGRVPHAVIGAIHDGGVVEIVVSDNGIGIPAEHAETIFGIFKRLHLDETVYTGTGIGLALCRWIAESHGGGIRLDPSHSNGACFRIALPRRQP